MGLIKRAGAGDAEEILGIYAYYVENTAVTFETETPSVDEFRRRVQNIGGIYPYLAYVENGEILGFATRRDTASAPRTGTTLMCRSM